MDRMDTGPAAKAAGFTSDPFSKKETFMKWETPGACDFRFGFEITMYVANR